MLWALGFGIAAPALVLTLDLQWRPLGAVGLELLPWRPYTATVAWAAMLAFGAWYPFRNRPGAWQTAAAGALAVAALLAGGIGLVLLPFALLFSIVGIGILGLVPLVTALVFARAARRAWRIAGPMTAPGGRLGPAAGAAALFAVGCLGAGAGVERIEDGATAVILRGDEGGTLHAEATLECLRWIPGIPLRRLRDAALGDGEPLAGSEKRAAAAYERITGLSPEEMLD